MCGPSPPHQPPCCLLCSACCNCCNVCQAQLRQCNCLGDAHALIWPFTSGWAGHAPRAWHCYRAGAHDHAVSARTSATQHSPPGRTRLLDVQDQAEDQQPSERQSAAPATQPRAIAVTSAAAARSRPVPVPGLAIHPSSAPCDSRLAGNPSPVCSPYTLHLAHHGKSQQHLPLPSPEDTWAVPQSVPRALPDPYQAVPGAAPRGSGSSGTSCASPLATSPAAAAPCRALVKHPSRGHSSARPMCIAMDASFESRRLLSSPEGILRSSSGRSDVFSSRGWSPAAATAEWGAVPHRQRLLQHPDGADQVRCSPAC